jgi:hypothetical protein
MRPVQATAGIALLFLSACALVAPPRATDLYLEPAHRDRLGRTPLELADVEVEVAGRAETTEHNARYIYGLLLANLSEGRDGTAYKIRVAIREQSFVKGFESRNTVSIETRIHDEMGREIGLGLYSEETEDTIASYSYLYDVIAASLNGLTR